MKVQITSEKIRDFLGLHFCGDDEGRYDGSCSVFLKKGDSTLLHVLTSPLSRLCDRLDDLTCYTSFDYYIMANTFTQKKGEDPRLFSLENIVIDLDLHGTSGNITKKCEDLLAFIQASWNEGHFEADLPCVNSVVFTGRGAQVWFAIESASASLSFMYEKVSVYLMAKMKEFIRRYDYRLGGFVVDRAASGRPMGIYRMPHTFNTKAGKFGEVTILSKKRLCLVDFYQNLLPIKEHNHRKKSRGHLFAKKRIESLHALLNYRKALGFPMGMMRDLFCFIAYNSCVHDLGHDEALYAACTLNDSFPQPLPEKELMSYLGTSFRKHYQISTPKMLELLCVSREEERLLGITSNKFRHVTKDDERKMVTYCRKGFNKKEIADKTGFSQTTVARVLKKLKEQTKREKAIYLIKRLIRKGKTVLEIHKETGEKLSVIRYYMKKSVFKVIRKHALFVMPFSPDKLTYHENSNDSLNYRGIYPRAGKASLSSNQLSITVPPQILAVPEVIPDLFQGFNLFNQLHLLPG